MRCPLCGSDNWATYSGLHATHPLGLSLECGGPKAHHCGWSIDLTREQMIEAAFLVVRQGAPGCAPDCHTWEGHHRPGCPNGRTGGAKL